MCGRYQRRSDKQRLVEAFHLGNVDGLALDFPPDYNAAPQSTQSVIVWDETTGTRLLHMMFWVKSDATTGSCPDGRGHPVRHRRPPIRRYDTPRLQVQRCRKSGMKHSRAVLGAPHLATSTL